MAVSRDLPEQLYSVSAVVEFDVLRAKLGLRAVHVVIVAQRDADRRRGEAVDVVDRRLARAAGHEGALVFERLVALRERLGLLREEVRELRVEDARLVA